MLKKIIDSPAGLVGDTLTGLALAHPDLLTVHHDPAYVRRLDAPVAGQVALVSGGGSGHEPLHTGFVGPGMLHAAVPGAVFTSPTPDAILAATRAVDGGAGVLYLVKNYTGDVLNFEMAAEMAGADGIPTATVLIDDDVAVTDSTFTAGRRGVAGAVLVEKIAGAAAAAGADLETVAELGRAVVRRTGSMGLALTSCTLPHVGVPSFRLGDAEVELGIGIHGEPGRERRPIAPAAELVEALLEPILADGPYAGSTVLLLVNGLGGTPLAELYIAFGDAHAQLRRRDVRVARSLVGNFATSLEMQGVSITLLRLDDELTRLWDAPVHTAALRWGG